jgi:hypothetical protein
LVGNPDPGGTDAFWMEEDEVFADIDLVGTPKDIQIGTRINFSTRWIGTSLRRMLIS